MLPETKTLTTGTATLGLIGEGVLFDQIQNLLAGEHQLVSLRDDDLGEGFSGLDAVLLVADGWNQELHGRLNRLSIQRQVPFLPAYVEPGAVIIGPCVLPEEPGCLTCAQGRRMRARTDSTSYAQVLDKFGSELAGPGASWMTRFAANVVGQIVAAEVDLLISDPQSMKTRGGFVRLRLDGLKTSLHRFLPDPLCLDCGQLADDRQEDAVIELKSRPKASPGSYRARSLEDERGRLFDLYVDDEAGLIRAVYKEGRNVFPSSSAPIGLRGNRRSQVGYGHQLDHAASQLTAVAEALERYGGIQPGGKRTVVRTSYNQLRDRALDPTTLGLHSDEQYDLPGFPYIRYHHDLTFNWVWGYSFARREPILVPENYAYYGTVFQETNDHPFVYEISNGCALGGCIEEAILYGIMEIAERDAFLMTWYARLSVPRIDPESARNVAIPLIIESIEHRTGYKLNVFNITMEHRVPCFWVMAVDEQGIPDMPKVLCASGSHPDPERALTSALLELAPMLSRPVEYYREQRDRVEEMLRDPYAVTSMEDHALLNGAAEAFERFDFLSRSCESQNFEDAFRDFYETPPQADLRDDLTDTLDRYLSTGLDVIVVDQTTPEQAAGDFRCVKVIIPGTLPMTFGHHARRHTGFDRLYRVPYELGYYDRPLTDADINPHPHPFP